MPQPPTKQRDRLKALMAVRVVLVTAFLGSAVAIDAAALADLSEPRNVTILGLIVLTYLMTIGYAVALTSDVDTKHLANAQIGGDLVVTLGLTLVTGGLDSLFLFFFHLTIINAAIVAGYRTALVVAGLTAASLLYFATISLGWLHHPILEPDLPDVTVGAVLYVVLIYGFAGLLIALLAGQLAERLGRAARQLERQKSDIAELQALNKNILSSMTSGLLTVDTDGVIIFFNRAAAEITGYTSDEVMGRPLERLFPDIASEAADQEIGEPARRLESTFERPDGSEVYLGFSLAPLLDSDDRAIGRIIIFQDLSEIKELERRMKRSERLAAVGELSASIAHEIRNPLASISGSVEMLETDETLSDADRQLMEIIVREVDRLDDLIGDFLDYSRPRRLETDRHELLPIIRDVARLFRANADPAEIAIEFTAEPDRPAVAEIDPESLRQIIWNLLQNAADAVEEHPAERRRIHIEIEILDDGSRVAIAVEDDGDGIDDDARPRLFEPFFTTREHGTGLGLATTHRLLEKQDGDIRTTDPRELRGARFEITLPLAEEEDLPNQSEAEGPPKPLPDQGELPKHSGG